MLELLFMAAAKITPGEASAIALLLLVLWRQKTR
jgi:hypothetical protein